MRIGIRTRAIVFGAIAALPLFALNAYNAEEMRRTAMADASRDALLLARTVARLNTDSINNTRHVLMGYSTGLSAHPESLFDAACGARLQKIVKANRLHLNVALADAQGEIHCSAAPLEQPVNVKDRPYFIRAVEEKGFALSGLLVSRDTGGPVIVAAQAIDAGPHPVPAVLLASFDVEALSRAFQDARLPPHVIVNLLATDGKIIARHPHVPEYIGQTLPDFPQGRAGADEGLFDLDGLDGAPRRAAYVRIPDLPSDPFYVVASIPLSHIESAPKQRLQRDMAALGATLALALVLGFLAAHMLIVRPLRQLADVARRYDHGELTVRTGIPHDAGEVGTLASALDALAENNQRITRALKALSAGNRTLLREQEESALLYAMCRVAVTDAGYRLALVNYAVHDERKSVRTAGMFGHDQGFVDALDLTWEDSERGRATVGPAIRTGQTTIIRGIRTDARFAPWRESAIAHEFGSVASFPLHVDGAVIGTFTLIASEENAFDHGELLLLEEMAADLSFGIQVLRSSARRQEAEAEARRATTHDPLTGLPGRVLFLRQAAQAVQRAAEHREALAVAVLHLPGLQDLHDSLGYEASNAAIRECAARLLFTMTPATVLARVADADFALLVPKADAAAAESLAQRLYRLLEAPVELHDVPIAVRAAFGTSVFPEHGANAEVLLRRASIAARDAGRREMPLQLYGGASERENPERLAIAAELRAAIRGRELMLHVQPKVDLQTRTVLGFEALVRWAHPQRGMVPPMQFIPIAEHTGLIRPLTRLMIELAARQLHAWRERAQPLPIAVNLSPRNLHDPKLIEHLEAALQAAGVPASLLEFEITESALAEDPQSARSVLERLRALGCKLYIDDFGTGYSSLSYLVSLPVDSLKIDRGFVRQMSSSRQARAIVSSVILMAKELGLRTVAEGVETQEDVDLLLSLGCNEAQGYFFGRPVSPEEYGA